MAEAALPKVLPDPAPTLVYTIRGMIGLFTGLELLVCCTRVCTGKVLDTFTTNGTDPDIAICAQIHYSTVWSR